MTVKDHYILCVAITPDASAAVGLTKLKGPQFLRGKLTFPGGRVEAGEEPSVAAARELLEESGVRVCAQDLVLVDEVCREDAVMQVYVAVTPAVLHARTLEAEPIWVLDVAFHQRQAASQPQVYAPDFLLRLDQALKVCRARAPALA